MNPQKITKNKNDHHVPSNFEMEDLRVVSQEIAIKEFYHFIEKTSFIQENFEMLSKVGDNLRLDFKDWPTAEQAIVLFKLNLQNGRKKSIKWSETEKKLFYWIVIRYCLYKGLKDNRFIKYEEWREISKIVLGRNAHQCRLKWEQRYRVPLSQIPWTEQEDQLLFSVHEEFMKSGRENKWSQIAKEIFKQSSTKVFRQPKQCRERWINRLDPNISNVPWDKQQEIDLLKMILIRGKKWSELSILYGRARTENTLKNKYNSLIKREIQKQEINCINPILFEKVQTLRQSYSKKYGIATPIEEIDNFECQFILLAIKNLYVELYLQEGRIAEAQKINNDEFFDYLPNDSLQVNTNQRFLYKKNLNIKKVDSNFYVNNDHSSLVIFNKKNNRIYLTPYNVLDFSDIILNTILKRVNLDNNALKNVKEQSSSINQPNFIFANQQNCIIPFQQMLHNYLFVPNCFAQSISSQTSNSFQFCTLQQSQQYDQLRSVDLSYLKNQKDLINSIGVDIKTVDSSDEI
ncbi:unnamed protein product [Paramecium octaurelia]|uniref:Uncharacterized protein n=1 Tax=Paramecium octaurelia TaxID=43137 RepID=A0A8S1UC34_PAROT|nr:unnamed protein product [Paramecium octaurelia]